MKNKGKLSSEKESETKRKKTSAGSNGGSKNKRKEILLNLGCGVDLLPGFINVDKYLDEKGIKSKKGLYANAKIGKGAKFVKADITKLPFKDNYADYIECLEALEHLPFRQVEVALREMYRVLKPGGKMVLMVPDMDDMCRGWLEKVTDKVFDHNTFFGLIQQFFGNQIHDGEYHKAGFTQTYLKGVINAVGFSLEKIDITLYPHGTHPPKFRGAAWNPRSVFVIGMDHVEATK